MGLLYSVASQPQVQNLLVATDLDFTQNLRFRITVANRFPAFFLTHHL